MHWILVGMMGSGKTSIGRLLAKEAGRKFVDTDRRLELKLGRSIPQIFALYGEDAFRCHETAILRELPEGSDVLSTGGGIVLREENWQELRRLGTTVYLRADTQTLCARLERSRKQRPLLQTEDWREKVASLLAHRAPLYERADHTVTVRDGSPDELVAELLALLKESP